MKERKCLLFRGFTEKGECGDFLAAIDERRKQEMG